MNEDQMNDADLWEHKVRSGMPKDQATQYVLARRSRAAQQPDQHDDERPERVDGVRGALGHVLQGATFGFSDELGAGVRALPALLHGTKAFHRSFDDNLENARTALRQFQEDHPIGAVAAELAGGVAGGLGAGAAAAGTKVGARAAANTLGRVVAEGAGVGALAGAGSAEGGVADRVKGAVTGAAFGATAGAALHPIGAVAKKVSGIAADFVRPAAAETASGEGAKAGAKHWRMLEHVTKLAGVDNADERATDLLLRALDRDGITIPDLIEKAKKSGKPITLADIAGENVTGLMRGANTVAGEGRNAIPEMLNARARGQGERILADVESGVGLTRDNVPQLADQLVAQRSANAAPLYEEAYAAGTITHPDVIATLDLPQFKKAYQRGMRIAKVQGVDIPDYFAALDKFGPEVAQKVAAPTVQAIDYMKRGLDDVIESGFKRGSIGKTEARALRDKLNETLALVDEEVPAYKQARASFAGDSGPIEALELGNNFFRMTPDELAHELEGMSDEQRTMFKRGAVNQVALALEGTGETADATRKILSNTLQRKKLRVLFDSDEAFQQFEDAMEEEALMARKRNTVLGGSNTANKLADIADMGDVDAGEAVNAIASRGLLRGAAHVAGRVVDKQLAQRARGITENTANALSSRFTLQGGDNLVPFLDELNQIAAEAAKRKPGRAAAHRGVSTTVGLMGGR